MCGKFGKFARLTKLAVILGYEKNFNLPIIISHPRVWRISFVRLISFFVFSAFILEYKKV